MRARRFSKGEMIAAAVMLTVLVVILWPTKGMSPRQHAKACEASCRANVRDIGVAVSLYAQDSAGFLPNANHWPSREGPPSLVAVTSHYYHSAQIYHCPDEKAGFFDRDGLSYNYGFGRLDIGQPPQLASRPFGEDPATFHLLGDFGLDWHPHGRTTLFADGHAKVLRRSEFREYELREP